MRMMDDMEVRTADLMGNPVVVFMRLNEACDLLSRVTRQGGPMADEVEDFMRRTRFKAGLPLPTQRLDEAEEECLRAVVDPAIDTILSHLQAGNAAEARAAMTRMRTAAADRMRSTRRKT